MIRFLLALARRYWLLPFVIALVTLALWSEWSFAPEMPRAPGSPGARETLLNELVTIAVCVAAAAVGVPAVLWLRPRRRALKSWLMAPFRSWAGGDDSRAPKL